MTHDRPLSDLRVLDLSRLLPGPYATMLLADMGAQVVKVESPQAPDYMRFLPPTSGGASAAFLTLNRNKRNLLLRFDTPSGREVIERLIERSDVLVESNRSGFLERLGIGPEAALARNPKLVYCSLSGYGQRGPYRDRAGHDLNFLALSGVAWALQDGQGYPPGVQMVDLVAGLAAVGAILAALWERQRSGQGRHIDLGLADAAMGLSVLPLAEQLACGQTRPPRETTLGGGNPLYGCYRCRDGRWLAVAALEPKFQSRLRQALGVPPPGGRPGEPASLAGGPMGELDWPGLDTWNADPASPLRRQLQEAFAQRDREDWLKVFDGLDACVEPVLEPAEVTQQPWVRQRNLVRTVATASGTMEQPGGTFDGAFGAPPDGFAAVAAGRHTLPILGELGYSEAEIEALLAAGHAAVG